MLSFKRVLQGSNTLLINFTEISIPWVLFSNKQNLGSFLYYFESKNKCNNIYQRNYSYFVVTTSKRKFFSRMFLNNRAENWWKTWIATILNEEEIKIDYQPVKFYKHNHSFVRKVLVPIQHGFLKHFKYKKNWQCQLCLASMKFKYGARIRRHPCHRLRIHRCATGDTSLIISLSHGHVISTRISGKYTCSNFNINVLQKNDSCRFVSDQDKNIASFVVWNIQGNFFFIYLWTKAI